MNRSCPPCREPSLCDCGERCPPSYTGPERRIPLDSPLLRRVVLWLLVFWLAVGVLAPLVANLVARAAP